MNIIYNHNHSKSGIFESSSKAQSEIQSCKLNESESRPNITLKKMGQELDKAETKCFTLKSELNYVMGVCQKVKSEMKGTKEKSDISLKPVRSSSENSSLKFSIEHNDYNSEIMTTNKIPKYNLQSIEHNTEDFDTLCSESVQLSPRGTVNNDDIIKESDTSKQQKQNELFVTIKPKTQLDQKLSIAMMSEPVQNEILKTSRGYENPKSYFPEYLGEHLQSMLNIEDSMKELTSKANENYSHAIPSNSAKRNIIDAKLNLNRPDIAKVRRAEKSKRISRIERSESNSVYNKSCDALSKIRKRKGRLRSSISKSTVTTNNKDTSLIGRREAKRRKHRGHGINHQSNLPRNSQKSNDVVEIFHNTVLKSSNSGISSKHSKFDKQTKCVKRHPSEIANQKIQETLYPECANREYKFDNKKNEQHNQYHQSSNYDSGTTPEEVQEHDESEKYSKDLNLSAQCKTHQSEHNAFNKCNDPMFTPSYEMPTLASRLKRSNRSYFSKFNFRNIPFVVGTSITPSHNLGLNIQQVLGVMKTRQPIANDITPLLIRKVSKGIPMSSLLEQINGYSERSSLSLNSHLTGIFNNCESSHINRDKKLSVFDLQHVENARTSNVSGNAKVIPEKDTNIIKPFNKEKIDSYDKIKQQSPIVANKSNMTANIRKQGVSKASSNKETNIGDYKRHTITGAQNSKEIRNILINLHDQFESMNTKYEKLQSEMKKSNNKSLAKELSAMEKELNVKEEEINVVISLYKEVMMLKQQMKMLHEKNSLICITTESAKESYKNPFPTSILPGKSHSMNPTQIFGRRKFNSTREPPTSMHLAALLRQIQTFHKQMQLVS